MMTNSFLGLGPHGFHRIAYTEWGDGDHPHAVICVHGLTRNARDFDWLAQSLQRSCRVACMDVVGRGESDWLAHKSDYTFRQYQSDAGALIARITANRNRSGLSRWLHPRVAAPGSPSVDWVGTSMGGLIGMLVAAQPGSPIRRLVLNDVGPFIPWPALIRLKGYLGSRSRYESLDEVERWLRQACAEWGPMSDDQWKHLATHSAQPLDDGGYRLSFDPAVGAATAWGWDPDAKLGNRGLLGLELWSVWEAISCPVLVLRGAESSVLPPETVARMRDRGPPVEVIELRGVGHAPSLMQDEQIEAVRRFLLAK
ncbi:MAG TPA: alpha/beta hydrolase [Burkholderiales bacterium]|nr:alpha/beta hydrolase [Burkholderiales bacterium]